MDLEQEIERNIAELLDEYELHCNGNPLKLEQPDAAFVLKGLALDVAASTRKQVLDEINDEVMDSRSLKSNRGLRLWLDSKMRGLQKGEEQPL